MSLLTSTAPLRGTIRPARDDAPGQNFHISRRSAWRRTCSAACSAASPSVNHRSSLVRSLPTTSTAPSAAATIGWLCGSIEAPPAGSRCLNATIIVNASACFQSPRSLTQDGCSQATVATPPPMDANTVPVRPSRLRMPKTAEYSPAKRAGSAKAAPTRSGSSFCSAGNNPPPAADAGPASRHIIARLSPTTCRSRSRRRILALALVRGSCRDRTGPVHGSTMQRFSHYPGSTLTHSRRHAGDDEFVAGGR